ncbi:hypothetical protein NQ317_016200 [Molorchus minor]|uniref:THAP-type domain-containing protein n=1 Tax=Molorchus minor TaxID=1323400 RepID=A0ABQ9J8T0_9CUCU|nr:hypothetical protein NQ317_016200 [Molorchus minor]
MRICFVSGCRSSQLRKKDNPELSFHRVPKDERKREQWFAAMGQKPCLFKYYLVCSKHFTKDCFDITSASGNIRIKPNAVPNIFPSRPNCISLRMNLSQLEDVHRSEFFAGDINLKRELTDDPISSSAASRIPKVAQTPGTDIYATIDPMICSSCVDPVANYLNLKSICKSTEERIDNYCATQKTDTKCSISLRKLLTFSDDDSWRFSDSYNQVFIKQEF